MNHWKVILATLVIFAAGVLTGNIATRKMAKPVPVAPVRPLESTNSPPPWQFESRRLMRAMEKELHLSHDQKKNVEKIMAQSRERSRAYWEELHPKLRDEFRRVREEIRTLLTPEQQTKFEEITRRRPQRRDDDKKRDDDKNRDGDRRKSDERNEHKSKTGESSER